MNPKLHHSITPPLLLCVLGASVVQSHAQTSTVPDRFKQLDKNADGRLTEDEISELPWLKKIFKSADANGDGALSITESRAATPGQPGAERASGKRAPQPSPAMPATSTADPLARELSQQFHNLDKNGDCIITPDEANDSKWFDRMHTDSFHVVSPYYGPGWGGSPVGNELHPGTAERDRFEADMIRDVLPDPGFWQDQHGRAIKMFKGTLARDFDGDDKPDLVTGAYADIWGGSMKRMQTPEDAKLDLDKDGIPDTTWPGGWDRGLFLLRNVSEPGKIRFEEVGNKAIERAWSDGTRYPQMHIYSIVAVDLDHDADLDLVVTGVRNSSAHRPLEDTTPIARVLRNESRPGSMRFTDITKAAGLDFLNVKQVPGYPLTQRAPNLAACAPIDFDNDGHTDLVFVDRQDGLPGDDPRLHPWVFRNTGHGGFERVPAEEHGLDGHFNDLSYADFDADGRLDLIFVHGDPDGSGKVAIYRNASSDQNHWVQINITEPGNPFGLESKVTVFKHGTQEILGYDEVRTDFCYRSKKSPTLHFGLGQQKAIDVKIRTRSGRERVFENLQADQLHTLTMNQP